MPPDSLDEVISEIATILARGYMRHRNGRRLAPDSDRTDRSISDRRKGGKAKPMAVSGAKADFANIPRISSPQEASILRAYFVPLA